MSSDLTFRVGNPSYPVLDAFRRDRSRIAMIMGPVGSGKTTVAVQRLLKQATEQPPNVERIRPTRWLVVRNTYKDLENVTIPDFLSIFGNLGQMSWEKPPTFVAAGKLDDGTVFRAEFIFQSLDRVDDVDATLRGYQLTGVWLGETKQLIKAVFDLADLRHGRYPSHALAGVDCGWHGMICDTNAWDTEHWLHPLFGVGQVPHGWAYFRQPGGVVRDSLTGGWVVNPLAENIRNLKSDYYSAGMRGKADDWIAVNLGNEYGFSIDGKPVHPEYVDSVHCPKDEIAFDPTLPLYLGVDYGRTPACAIAQFVPQWGRTVVIDELVTDDMSAADFGPLLYRELGRRYPGAKIAGGWSDPAGDSKGQATNDTPRSLVVAAGVPMRSAPTNDPILRRAAVSRPLQRMAGDKPALLISPKAKTLRQGLAGGFCFRRLKVAGSERYTDEPDKNKWSHVVEGLEYLMLGLGEGAEALKPVDPVRGNESIQVMAEM